VGRGEKKPKSCPFPRLGVLSLVLFEEGKGKSPGESLGALILTAFQEKKAPLGVFLGKALRRGASA